MAIEDENPDLDNTVETGSELKTWLIDYVGEQHRPENGDVTVGMVVDTLATEFPEFLLVVAEENFIRGYKQALVDADSARELLEKEMKENDSTDKEVVASEGFSDKLSHAILQDGLE